MHLLPLESGRQLSSQVSQVSFLRAVTSELSGSSRPAWGGDRRRTREGVGLDRERWASAGPQCPMVADRLPIPTMQKGDRLAALSFIVA